MTYGQERVKSERLVSCDNCKWQGQRKYLELKTVFIDLPNKEKPEYMTSYWACPMCGEKII